VTPPDEQLHSVIIDATTAALPKQRCSHAWPAQLWRFTKSLLASRIFMSKPYLSDASAILL
jgi:hypothetical protein